MRVVFLGGVFTIGICVRALAAGPSDPALLEVAKQVERIAQSSSGVVGVTAVHLESGVRISVNGNVRFPMASVYKLPIVLQVLKRVDRGELDLSRRVCLSQKDLRPGYSSLAESWRGKDICLPIKRLVEVVLRQSDNMASDYLFQLAGGAKAVTANLRELGIQDMRVDRQEIDLISGWRGVKKLPPPAEWSLQKFDQMRDAVPEPERRAAASRFDQDPRDTSTPDAMVALLRRIHRREVLAPATHRELVRLMQQTMSGPDRIKGLLPAGTVVAHRTGTMGGTTNDVGIIDLPDRRGHLALAVFIKSSSAEVREREKVIARISRALFDHFAARHNNE